VGWVLAIIVVGAVAVVGFGSTLLPMFQGMSDQNALRTEGVEAPAKILEVVQTRSRFNEDWVFELELEVHPEGGKPYWAKVSQPFSVIHVPNLRQGGAATVRFDRADPQKIVVMSTGGSLPPTLAPPTAGTAAAKPDDAAAPDPSAAAPTDPVCIATTACCLRVMGKAGAASCAGFASGELAGPACAAALSAYQATARARGTPCQ